MRNLSDELISITPTPLPYPMPMDLVKSIVASVSNQMYELVFVADVKTDSLIFLSNVKGLVRHFDNSSFESRSLSYLIETMSGKDIAKFRYLITSVESFIRTNEDSPLERMLFMTDLEYVLNDENNLATYKVNPILVGENRELQYIVGSIGFSTGVFKDEVYAIDVYARKRYRTSLYANNWKILPELMLSKVELSVLSLVAQGMDVLDVATHIGKSPNTVKTIRKRLYEKLDAKNAPQALMNAIIMKIL